MPEAISGVYVILCTANGRRYIGSSNNVWRRFREHRSELRRAEHHSPRMQADWNEHGEAAFSFFVAMTVSDGPERFAAEQALLDACDAVATGYNTAPDTYCLVGTKRTPEQCENLRASWTPERRKKIAETHGGSRNQHSRLRAEQVMEIRRRLRAGVKGHILAVEFGVTDAAITAIRTGKVWRELPDSEPITLSNRRNMATITEEQVLDIRRRLADGETGRSAARALGVSEGLISMIRNGHVWAHVQPAPPLTT
jgi:group I intron endonuclease